MSEGFVYVIMASSGHVKIGKANNVDTRLATLRTASPFPLTLVSTLRCADPREIEKLLHRKFSSKRTHGEWFLLDPREMDYLAGLNEETDLYATIEDAGDEAVNSADIVDHWIDLNTPLWGEL